MKSKVDEKQDNIQAGDLVVSKKYTTPQRIIQDERLRFCLVGVTSDDYALSKYSETVSELIAIHHLKRFRGTITLSQ